ncbi:hypothetical protein ACWEP3_08210, partial [Streptomyces albidoflavus]
MALRDSTQGTECQEFLSFEICWSHMSDDRSGGSHNAGYDPFRPPRFTPDPTDYSVTPETAAKGAAAVRAAFHVNGPAR